MQWGDIFQPTSGCLVSGVASLSCLPIAFMNFLDALLMFAGTIAAIMIVISGIRMMLSTGDAKQLETAQKTLMYAIVGLILIFLSFLIINIIGAVTGVTCITIPGPWASNNCTVSR